MTPADAKPRNIVLFSDGTGNSRGKLFKTNVWRTYQALDVTDPAEPPAPRQFAFYDDGVGSESVRVLSLLGGALGIGLERNVRELYAFLCRTYRPGDRIYAFGFSRGAFTIRILVGLVLNQGVLPYGADEADLDRRIRRAYRAYRRGYKTGMARWWLQKVRKKKVPVPAPAFPEARRTQVEFIGVWDTVDAYGMPIAGLAWIIDTFLFPMSMPNLRLHKDVRQAVQALAVDDERRTFHPRVWDDEPPSSDGHTRIRQVWFAGMHSDVGGGYADEGMSHVSLNWVLKAASAAGLRFLPRIRGIQQELADENGPMNDSRRGLAAYYRYAPRSLPELTHGGRVCVHESVLRRIASGHDGYAPIALPEHFQIERIDGQAVDAAGYLTGWDAERYAAGRARVFQLVGWRRAIYTVTLVVSMLLLVSPWVMAWVSGRPVCTEACTSTLPLTWIGNLLPDLAQRWLDVFEHHGVYAWPLAAVALVGMRAGDRLQRAIRDRMRKIWYAVASLCPGGVAAPPP